MLQVLDNLWKEHLATMDHLRQGIHLRGYGQKNPKQEYKRESFILFEQLLQSIKHDAILILADVVVQSDEVIEVVVADLRAVAEALADKAQYQHGDDEDDEAEEPAQRVVGRAINAGRH